MKLFLRAKFRRRSHIRAYMRGYNCLKKEGRLDLIAKIKHHLSNTTLIISSKSVSEIIFGNQNSNAELITRQFLVERALSTEFNKSLLIAQTNHNKEIRYPLPKEWRLVLEEYGFQADTVRNRLQWWRYTAILYLKGLIKLLLVFVRSLQAVLFSNKYPETPYSYFIALSKKNMPVSFTNGKVSHDVFSWYTLWKGKEEKVKTLCHDVKATGRLTLNGYNILEIQSPIPHLKSFVEFVRFFFWSLAASFMALIDLIRGKYWHGIMLGEAVSYKQVSLLNKDRLALEFLFHNSGHIYRPLWTYAAEELGSKVFLYFYSTNIESFKSKKGYFQEYSWQLVSWQYYLVWDKYQASFIERASGTSKGIQIVGPIGFIASNANSPSLANKNCIAVFDVQPMRESKYQGMGWFSEYYLPHNANQFLEDIATVTNKLSFDMIMKRKRSIPGFENKRYKSKLELLKSMNLLTEIEPESCPYELIEQSKGVISMPFTSTAILARHLGKPFVYYDPHGEVCIDDRAAHGIPIISGKKALETWLENLQ